MLLPLTKDDLHRQCYRLYQPTLDKIERILNAHGVYFSSPPGDPMDTPGNMEARERAADCLAIKLRHLDFRRRLASIRKELGG